MDIKRLKNGYKRMTGTGKEVLRFLEMKSWSENVRKGFDRLYFCTVNHMRNQFTAVPQRSVTG